jgi:hypothetical protein
MLFDKQFMFLKRALGLAVFFVGAQAAQAGGLFAPFSLDSTGTLPKGVRNVRLSGFTTEITDKYTGAGNVEPLASAFNKPVTWKQLTDAQPAGFERGQFRGGLRSLGINMDQVVGESRGVVNTRVTTTLPVLAYGVTERLTVGLAVPIVYSNVNVDTGWSASSSFQATLDKLSRGGFYNKVLANEAKLQNVVATKIASYGYKPLENETRTDVGDVTVAAKYLTYKNEKVALAVAPRVVIPTGRKADVDKLVDVAPGDGQWDVGVSAVADYFHSGAITFNTSAGYMHQFESNKAKRIPASADESLSADIDPFVREKLGDIASAGLGARYAIRELWTLGAAYNFQYKFRDAYYGGAYAPERYNYLSEGTEQNMHTATVGASFSTIPLFRSKRFAVPMEAGLNYSTVFAGRNVSRIALTSFDLAMFF